MPESSTKKRKQPSTSKAPDSPAKKSKKSSNEKRDKKDAKLKGKARDTEFHVVNTSLVVSIAPIFANNLRVGVEEMLDSMVMRYIPALRGVVLSHSNLRFLTQSATVQADCPFLVCKVEFDATIWSPHVGMKLVGKVNLCSPDHISLLLHRTFNVSIPRHHIPKGEWEFEYGPAENDPEFGADANDEEVDDEAAEASSEKQDGDGGGKWVHHITGAKLGGADGLLEFTVIGLTVANEMLSLLGSVQSDPFSPDHVPETGSVAKRDVAESEMEASEVQREMEMEMEEEVEQEEEEDSDEDTFKTLGRMTDEAVAAETTARQRAEAAALVEKEKKRKRKTEKAEGKKQKRTKS